MSESRARPLSFLSRLSAGFTALQRNPVLRSALRRRLLLAKGELNRLSGRSVNREDVEAYELMKADNRASGALYTAGKFWDRFNRMHARAIWGGGLTNLRNEYFNRTFSGPEPESRQVYRALLYLFYKHVKQLDVEGFLASHEDPEIGGAYDQERIEGRLVSLDFLQSVEEAYRIRQGWRLAGRDGSPRVVVELGAGYGRLAYVMRKMLPSCSYVILDLPEALICAQSWLGRVLGDEVVEYAASRGVTGLVRADFEAEGRVFLLLPHQIEAIGGDAADAFVNIYSFAEMPPTSIENYFRHLDRITAGVLYTKQRMIERNVLDDVQITEETYPVPPHWRRLFRFTSTLYDGFFEAAYATR